jgi:hypothetical protein
MDRQARLRAFPLGNSTEYRARDYLILDRWILEFLEDNSVTRAKKSPDDVDSDKPSRRQPAEGVKSNEPEPAECMYNLQRAADRCGVAVEIVHEWVTQRGLRAFPVGDGISRPRDYLILDSWIIGFIVGRAVTRQRNADGSFMGPPPRRYRGDYGSREDGSAPLGKCPV